jgi:hypothetical protein
VESPTLVLGVCFLDLPQRALIAEAVEGMGAIKWIDEPVELTAALKRGDAAAALFPPEDVDGHSTTFLVSRCMNMAPTVPVALVAIPKDGGAHHLRRSWARGSHLLFVTTAEELRTGIRELIRGHVPAADLDRLERLLERLFEAGLARLLVSAVRAASRRLSADDFARMHGVSASTMRRCARRAGWPSPSELVRWGRVMRLALSPLRSTMFVENLARQSGFRDARAMRATCRRLLNDERIQVADVSLDMVLFGLRGRMHAR